MNRVMLVIGFLVVFSSFLIACEPVKTDVVFSPLSSMGSKTDNATNTPNIIQLPPPSGYENVTSLADMEAKMNNVPWLYPGKVYIDNLFPDSQAESILRIHNEKNEDNPFSVYLRVPDYTDPNYERLPEKFYKWVIVPDKIVTVGPGQIKDTLITIKMDRDDQAVGKKYEIWIAIMDESQTGMVKTELCSRWFISTQ